MYYIHPELRIGDYGFGSGKGAGRELGGARESTEGAL